MENNDELNPWLSIWIRPRATMRLLLQKDPDEFVILLVCFAGFSEILINASKFSLGDHVPVPVIFSLAIIMGPVIGILGLFLGALLFRWTGQWLDGEGTYPGIRAAIAWSCVPIICYSVLWIPKFILLGDVLFVSRVVIWGSKAHIIAVGFNVLRIIIVIWSLIIFLKCLSEVQKFSVWKAIGNTILSITVLVIIVFFIRAVIDVSASSI